MVVGPLSVGASFVYASEFYLASVEYAVLNPFAAYGVEAGIKYSKPDQIAMGLGKILKQLAACLYKSADIGSIMFNRMDELGGRADKAFRACL